MKIFFDTVGCRLNQAEIENLARQFRLAGHEIVASAEKADLAVINTCTVTAQAASDSRQKIRQAARLGAAEIVLTGCWSTLEPEEAASMPGVTLLVPNLRKDSLAVELLGLPSEFFDIEPLARQPLPGLHARTRAFIKVQDGCDNRCTYCITSIARGSSHSRPVQAVLEDVCSALAGGTKEIVLTGVHLGAWGQEWDLHLSDLVREIMSKTDAPRLRLSSLEPWDLNADFFALWQEARMCRHLHLPLQSGSASVLHRMGRKTSPRAYAALLEAARNAIPGVAITTDLIAGFPGETEEEFSESFEFVRGMSFASGHVFTYSARPGTAAARMPDQVPNPVRKRRNLILRQVCTQSADLYRQKFIGASLPVLWESAQPDCSSGWILEGLTDNYLRVTASSPQPRWNQLDEVRLTGLTPGGLNGVICK